MIQIRTISGALICQYEVSTVKEAVERAAADGRSLAQANLANANLEGANLIGANFESADLESASFVVANLVGANLRRARLRGANLRRANLDGADFSRATLQGATMTHGETFEEYQNLVVLPLLTAGGKTLEEVLATGCWECHGWENCPMHVALDIDHPNNAPPLLRPRVREFVQLFDAGLLDRPTAKT